MTLEQFRTLFGRAAAPLGAAPSDGPRGDHDLNPGFTPRPEARPAAVLVPVVDRPDGATILLTRRSDDLPVHAGQVSFPGGRVETSDRDPVHTALRESEEEIGLDPGAVTVLGRMDTYLPGTGYAVVPVVGLLNPPLSLTPDPREVAEIFEVPLALVCDRENHRQESAMWKAKRRHYYVMPYKHYHIWGATAGMLVNLVDMIDRGRSGAAAD